VEESSKFSLASREGTDAHLGAVAGAMQMPGVCW